MNETTRVRAVDPGDAHAAAAGADPSGAFTHRQIRTIIVGLMVAMFLAALDQTVVATAIRTIADDLQGYDLQAWATTAFLITSTIATPLYGKLSDIYGRRPFYLFAIAVFVLGSVLCGLADTMYQLAAFRAVQGIGAGGLMSLALAIIGDIVPPRERSRYQGYFMAVFGTSSVLGPVIGGFLAGQSSLLGITGWRWIFYVNVPLGLLAFAAVYRVLHLPHERREHRIDWPGALSLVTCIVPLLIVAEQGRTWGWTSASAVACYCIGAVGFGAFLLAERAYGDEALLPLRLFRNRTFRIAIVGSTVVGAAMFGGLLLLPQYLQIVHGSSATVAGLQMIPLVAGIMAGAASSGVVISRTGRYKVFPLAGTVLMATALASLSVVVGAGTSLGTLAPFMVLLGIGLGFNFQPAVLAVQNAVPPDEMGVATSSVTFFRQMGATLGTAAFLSVLVIRLPVEIEQAVTSAAAGDPRVAEAVQSGRLPAGGDLSDTSFVQGLPSHLALPFEAGFSDAIDLVFLIAACVAALGFFVFLLLPQLALSTTSGIEARQAAARRAAGAPAAGATTEQAVLAAGAAAPMSTPRPTGRPRHAATRRTRPPIPVPPGRRWLLAGLGRATSAAPPRRVRGRTRHLLVSAAALGMLIGAGGAVQASRDPGDGQAADGRTSAVGGGNADTPVSTGPTLIPSPLADTTLPEPSPPVEQETTSGGAVPSPAAGGTPLVQAPPATTAAGTTAAGTTAAGTTAAGTTAAGTTAAGTTAVPTTETAVPTTETAVPTTETAVPTTETAVPTTETAVPTTETAVPTTETAVPTTETAVPTTETAVPTTETAVPTTETAVPTTETAVPTTETSTPAVSTGPADEGTSATPSP